MYSTQLPLLNLFQRLRNNGLRLGTEDYMLALGALQAGFGIGNRSSLEQLCCTLWTKSPEEALLLKQLLNLRTDESSQPVQKTTNTPLTQIPLEEITESTTSSTSLQNQQTSDSVTNQISSKKEAVSQLKQRIQAKRYNQFDSIETTKPHRDGTDKYLPVSSRQINQSWRFLRHLIRKDKLPEWDITATLEKLAREGVIAEPVLGRSYKNQVKVILLVDRGGSMVPFHHLSDELVDKALQGGDISQISIYYFHNYPEKYLYTDPTRLKAKPTEDVLSSFDKKTAVLIISDAGAARGNYNDNREKKTQEFLQKLKKSVRYYAWLNPIPKDSWQYTTADDIARLDLVPMFEMSLEGLNASINTLRGRHVY